MCTIFRLAKPAFFRYNEGIPEEGWFGQPKYSTHKKDPSTLCRLLPLFSSLREHRKPQKLSNKNSSFNGVHSILTGSMNASYSTNLFINSCHHISTNGKVTSVVIQPSTNSLIKPNLCFTLPPTQHHSFFRN